VSLLVFVGPLLMGQSLCCAWSQAWNMNRRKLWVQWRGLTWTRRCRDTSRARDSCAWCSQHRLRSTVTLTSRMKNWVFQLSQWTAFSPEKKVKAQSATACELFFATQNEVLRSHNKWRYLSRVVSAATSGALVRRRCSFNQSLSCLMEPLSKPRRECGRHAHSNRLKLNKLKPLIGYVTHASRLKLHGHLAD